MVKTCYIRKCRSESYRGCGISFHGFPRDEELCQKWIDVIPVQKNHIKKTSLICGFHFKDEDYCFRNSRRMLKTEAVPSIFPGPNVKPRDAQGFHKCCDPTHWQLNSSQIPDKVNYEKDEMDLSEQSMEETVSSVPGHTGAHSCPIDNELRRKVKLMKMRLKRRDIKLEILKRIMAILRRRRVVRYSEVEHILKEDYDDDDEEEEVNSKRDHLDWGERGVLLMCRMCLSTDRNLYRLAGHRKMDLAYRHLTGLTVEEEADLPPFVCAECGQRLRSCARLRSAALRAHSLLLVAVNTYNCITPDSINEVIGKQSRHLRSNLSVTDTKVNHYDLIVKNAENGREEGEDIRDTEVDFSCDNTSFSDGPESKVEEEDEDIKHDDNSTYLEYETLEEDCLDDDLDDVMETNDRKFIFKANNSPDEDLEMKGVYDLNDRYLIFKGEDDADSDDLNEYAVEYFKPETDKAKELRESTRDIKFDNDMIVVIEDNKETIEGQRLYEPGDETVEAEIEIGVGNAGSGDIENKADDTNAVKCRKAMKKGNRIGDDSRNFFTGRSSVVPYISSGKSQPVRHVNSKVDSSCVVCHKAFKHKIELKEHLKKHTRKLHGCWVCEEMFYTNQQLQSHLRTHDKKRRKV